MTVFRTATRAELDHILEMAAAEGWNPGLEDAAVFHGADPDGFFVASDGGRPVAAISVVNHCDRFAFLGLYIAAPSHRGRGIGLRLWLHALAHAGDRTVGLDGVPDQQENYAASGFRKAGGTTRFTGSIVAQTDPAIRPAAAGDIAGLIDREAAATGMRKPAYLGGWFRPAPSRVTLIADRGFCTVRQCREGAKIGPLLAGEPATAAALIRHAATVFDGPVTLDVPDSAADLAGLCRSFGLTAGFETARMYKGPPPVAPPSILAVTSLELG